MDLRALGYGVFIACFVYIVFITTSNATERDIVFVLDKSGSVNASDFKEAVDFVYNVTKWLTIGPSNILVSAVTFSSRVDGEFDLDDHVTNSSLLSAIRNLESIIPRGGTYTFDALRFVRDYSLTSSAGARTGVPKAVVVLTDGLSASAISTTYQAEKLHNDSVEVYAVGIGNAAVSTNKELADIASDPDSYYLHQVDQFQYLCALVPELVPKLDNDTLSSPFFRCPTAASTTLASKVTSPSTQSNSTMSGSSVTTISQTSDDVVESSIALIVGATLAALGVVGVASIAAMVAKKYFFEMKTPSDVSTMFHDIISEYKEAPLGEKKPQFQGKIRGPEVDVGLAQGNVDVIMSSPPAGSSLR